MKLIKNITVLFLAGIFLMSVTGLSLRFHDCYTCDISGILVNSDEHEHSNELHESCCSDMIYKFEMHDENDCCSDDIFYIKISEPFVFSTLNIDFRNTYSPVLEFFTSINHSKKYLNDILNISLKPPNISGFKLLLNICILKL